MIDKWLYSFFGALDNLFEKLHNVSYERYKNIRDIFKKSKRRKSKKTSF